MISIVEESADMVDDQDLKITEIPGDAIFISRNHFR